MNEIVSMYADVLACGNEAGFGSIMPRLVEADADCGGLLALPFMDDEPGVGVKQGGTAMLIGLNRQNLSAGNVAKAALLAPIFNLKLGLAPSEAFAHVQVCRPCPAWPPHSESPAAPAPPRPCSPR